MTTDGISPKPAALPGGLFARLFRWLETRIDIFAPFPDGQVPPTNVWRFMWWHIREIKGWLLAILLTGLAFSGIEAALYLMVGWVVDLLASTTPDALWRDHGWTLIGIAAVVLIIRPIVYFMNHAVVDQVVMPAITNRIRWRSHVYTLGHALNYFNNDFAGRVGSRVIQVGQSVRGATIEIVDDLWYVLVFAGVAIGFFAQTSLWFALPVAVWLVAYIVLLWYFVPRAMARSEANSHARSRVTGRVTDAYTNIMTVKLFARGETERNAVASALDVWNRSFFDLTRLITGASAVLQLINSLLIVVSSGMCLYFWAHGAMTPGGVAAAIAIALRLVQMSGWVMNLIRGIFENIGAVQESMETIAKPHGVVDGPGATPLAVTRGEIRFEHVRFHYGKGSGVFDDLNLTIRPGEKVGLIGPSGAGKSTLVNLLLRL
ncbi:MAG: ABC transporter transmembrane domain-containing protein, partial [Beijerinckiaceae bacterium]